VADVFSSTPGAKIAALMVPSGNRERTYAIRWGGGGRQRQGDVLKTYYADRCTGPRACSSPPNRDQGFSRAERANSAGRCFLEDWHI